MERWKEAERCDFYGSFVVKFGFSVFSVLVSWVFVGFFFFPSILFGLLVGCEGSVSRCYSLEGKCEGFSLFVFMVACER